jgi:hypothetical protein
MAHMDAVGGGAGVVLRQRSTNVALRLQQQLPSRIAFILA